MKTREKPLTEAEQILLKERIEALDLEPIKFKLVAEYGWSLPDRAYL